MLLSNGRIYTLDPGDRVVDTLVVRAGRVVFAGRRGDVNVPAGEAEIDLGGRAVLPGLVDAHGHLMYLARLRLTLDVAGLASEAACAGRVAARAAAARAGEWIAGRGWDQNRWPGARFPTRASLDRAAPDHPVALVRVDGHAIWASSTALRIAGIDRNTPDPSGGRLERDGSGEPTGVLVDAAQELIRRVEPRPGPAQLEDAVRAAIADCLAVGLTGVHEMGADLDALAAYRRLAAAGAFPFRNHVALKGADAAAWQAALDEGPAWAGDGRLAVGAVKLMADGALGSRGAALHAPYCDDPANRGLLLLPVDELEARARAAAARGFQVCVHAIGDRANTLVLDALEAVIMGRPSTTGGRLAAIPGADPRHRVEHAQILAESDIPRFRALGVLPSMQPTHCTSDMPWADTRLGAERIPGAYAWRSLLRTGTLIAGGSDFPVELPNPFYGIHAAVTRRPRTGPDPGWQPEQRMTRAEAARAFTAWNAYAAHQEAELGTLESGKQADLVVCSADVFTCPEPEMAAIEPVLSMVAARSSSTGESPPDGDAAAMPRGERVFGNRRWPGGRHDGETDRAPAARRAAGSTTATGESLALQSLMGTPPESSSTRPVDGARSRSWWRRRASSIAIRASMRRDRRPGFSWATTGGPSLTVETAGPGSLDRVSSTTNSVASTTASARLIQRSTLGSFLCLMAPAGLTGRYRAANYSCRCRAPTPR